MKDKLNRDELLKSVSEYHIRNIRESTQAFFLRGASPQKSVVPIVLACTAAFWTLDAALGYFFFFRTSFWGLLIFDIPAQALYVRLTIMAFLIVIGFLSMELVRADKLDRALKKSSKWFSTTLKSIGAALIATDKHGDVIFMNREGQKLTGWRLDHAVGKSVDDICQVHYENDPAGGKLPLAHLVRHGEGLKLASHAILEAADGTSPPIGGNISPITDDTGQLLGAVMVLQDLTAYIEAEESRRRLVAAVEQAPDATLMTDVAGQVTYVNPSFERITGYQASEIVGKHIGDFGATVQDPAALDELRLALGQRETWRGRFSFKGKNEDPCELETVVSGVRNSEGELINYVSISRDLTREMELQAQLLQAQKLEAIGLLADGVAHDFNNLLTVMNGYARLLGETVDPEGPTAEFSQEIVAAGERAVALTRQLLTFSRRKVVQAQMLDLNDTIGDTAKMLRRLIGENIGFETELAEDLGMIKADPGQIEQVIMNLVVNAGDAMPDGGALTVSTATIQGSELTARDGETISEGPYAVLRVQDGGTGIDEATLAQMFEPFFTTKESGKGTGLGLSMIANIVRQSSGVVRVETTLGEGSCFSVYLPIVPDEAVVVEEGVVAPLPLAGRETILVVEDDAMLRALAERVLTRKGYQVLLAGDGVEGLEVCTEHKGVIQLMLTDVVMPVLGGRQLSQQAAKIRPEMKIIFMTGYVDHDNLRDLMEHPTALVLRKPFTNTQLLKTIRTALDGTTTIKG